MAGTRLETVFSYAILALFSLAVVLPVGWLLLAATSPKANAGVDLENIRLANFVDAWVQADFTTHLLNSLIICVGAVVITSAVSILAGYGLTILAMPGSRIVFPIILAGIMIPLEGILVPLYFNLRAVGLTSSLFGLVIAHAGLGRVLRRLLDAGDAAGGAPRAGRVGRAGRRRPAAAALVDRAAGDPTRLITMVLLMFMWTWNDYFLAFVLINDEAKMPVTLALGSFSTRYTQQLNLMAAAAVLVALPVLILYMFFQRQFIQGVMSGALKG